MSQDAEFEEKSYENALVVELAVDSRLSWCPGQVFENHFGIDAAILVNDPAVWLRLMGRSVPSAVILQNLQWKYLWRRVPYRKLPTFALNLFLQVKRPEVLSRRTKLLRSKMISTPYYRFFTRRHQQSALARLADKLKSRAVVCYASPAFHSNDDLFQHIENGTLSATSTFVRVRRLEKHDSWAYDQPGSRGFACSDPEDIDDESLFSEIVQLMKSNIVTDVNTIETQGHLLQELARVVLEVCREEIAAGNPLPRIILVAAEKIGTYMIADSALGQAARSFVIVQMFCRVFELSWLVLGEIQ